MSAAMLLFAAWIGAPAAEITATLEVIGEVSSTLQSAITGELETSMRELTGKRLAIASPGTVSIKLIAGPRRIRLIAERKERELRAEADLSREATTFRVELDEVVRRLFPEWISKVSLEIPAAPVPVKMSPESNAVRWAAWIVSGTSVALLGAGIGFGASNRSALNALESSPDEFDKYEVRARTHGTAANLFFVGAAAAAGTGLILFLVE